MNLQAEVIHSPRIELNRPVLTGRVSALSIYRDSWSADIACSLHEVLSSLGRRLVPHGDRMDGSAHLGEGAVM